MSRVYDPSGALVTVGSPGVGFVDGDYGDLVISGGVTAMDLDSSVATTAGRAVMAGANAAAQRTSLGLGTAALSATSDFDAAGAAAAAAAASLPLHSTADDSAKLGGTTPSSFMLTVLDDANAATARTTLGAAIGSDVQAWDADLDALAGLSTAADKVPYWTGIHAAALADFTAAGRALVDDATASDQRTTLGLGTAATHAHTDYDAAGAATAAAAASLPLHSTADNATQVASTTPTSTGLGILAAASAAAVRTLIGLVIGTDVQAYDGELAALAGLTSAADKVAYFTGSARAALADFTSFGRSLVAAVDAAATRTLLGLGTLATQSGTFSGTSSGTNTGDQTSVSGNAGTATALQTARAINGVNFDGTAPITVTAAGSTLSDTVTIGKGGTGQITAVAAKDALSTQSTDIASAGTTDLSTATGDFAVITGTVTITAFGTCAAGVERTLKFAAALTLTHNGTSLILPGAANITTAANDTAVLRSLGSGNWLCVEYSRAASPPASGANTGDQTNISGNAATVTTNANLTGPITSAGNATSVASQTGTGSKFVMDTAPTLTAPVHAAGSASAASWPKMTSGTVLTSPEAGAHEYDGNCFYVSPQTSNRGVLSAEYIICLGSAYTLTNTGSVQKIFNSPANGALTLPTGTYIFEMLISLSSMSATSGNAQFDIKGGGGATVSKALFLTTGFDAATGTVTAENGAMAVTQATPNPAATATTNTNLQIHLRGTFRITGAGTIIPSLALTNAAAAVVAVGSYFRCHQIGDASFASVGPWS